MSASTGPVSDLPLHQFTRWLAELLASDRVSCAASLALAAATAVRLEPTFRITDRSLPSVETLARRSRLARGPLTEPSVERAVESIVAWILTCDPHDPNEQVFERFFDGAFSLVYPLAREVIQKEVRWLGESFAGLRGQGLERWVQRESASVAALLLLSLARGTCECWTRWEDVHQESEREAQAFCESKHRLAKWDRRTPLSKFLFEAMVHGSMTIGGRPRANGFRKGMLAKSYFDGIGKLQAGPTLRSDRHDSPSQGVLSEASGETSDAREVSWWIWPEGTWKEVKVYRCAKLTQVFQAHVTDIQGLGCFILEQCQIEAANPSQRVARIVPGFLATVTTLADGVSGQEAKDTIEFHRLTQAFNEILNRMDFYDRPAWPEPGDPSVWPDFFLPEDHADLLVLSAMPLEARERASRNDSDVTDALKSLKFSRDRLRALNRRLVQVAYDPCLRPEIGCGRLRFHQYCPRCRERANWQARTVTIWIPKS